MVRPANHVTILRDDKGWLCPSGAVTRSAVYAAFPRKKTVPQI